MAGVWGVFLGVGSWELEELEENLARASSWEASGSGKSRVAGRGTTGTDTRRAALLRPPRGANVNNVNNVKNVNNSTTQQLNNSQLSSAQDLGSYVVIWEPVG
ncbi:uncharacterized protein PADG_02301 [Paracoccidioides brasiliensis Pb18]|uniref:Uncharacterized protein n=1 Tax=Paracoccidioides brasiliensis (strain Pb18) TaxID=502780 RepID=C1G2D5_PARBD|nr:uncharacterized protein PADG_02301 [Paracoccidioides brasiliensis Pb18]EEH46151.1 hypothetical protein PADG_02301 [Paracoccidioides brasiliensis Pb18]